MKKDKGFFAEFKKFILRGNVIDLAVGVIIGGAFQTIVKSLVDDIVMPVIGLITKGVDFTSKFVTLDGNAYATLKEAQDAGAAVITYGNFISAVLNILIMAFVIFSCIKLINTIIDKATKKKDQPEEAPTTKKCPYCCTEIDIAAVKCPHCTSDIEK